MRLQRSARPAPPAVPRRLCVLAANALPHASALLAAIPHKNRCRAVLRTARIIYQLRTRKALGCRCWCGPRARGKPSSLCFCLLRTAVRTLLCGGTVRVARRGPGSPARARGGAPPPRHGGRPLRVPGAVGPGYGHSGSALRAHIFCRLTRRPANGACTATRCRVRGPCPGTSPHCGSRRFPCPGPLRAPSGPAAPFSVQRSRTNWLRAATGSRRLRRYASHVPRPAPRPVAALRLGPFRCPRPVACPYGARSAFFP